MAHLVFDNVSIDYPIYNAHSMSLRHKLVSLGTGGKIASDASNVVTVTALKSVSFSLKDGDSVAIIGHNGAGKSTLLRTMAGIYTPSTGRVDSSGDIATVFELGAGMDPELSGYENITRMLLLTGHSPGSVSAAVRGIEEFSELGDFLQLPVRTYSSGMTMRLMFAVATARMPSILLIDEMFGTGDADFQIKARKRMEEYIDHADIFVFASHDHGLLRRLCKRFFRLEHGSLVEVSAAELN